MRKKRHDIVYWQPELVSEEQAKNAVKIAEEFLMIAKEILK